MSKPSRKDAPTRLRLVALCLSVALHGGFVIALLRLPERAPENRRSGRPVELSIHRVRRIPPAPAPEHKPEPPTPKLRVKKAAAAPVPKPAPAPSAPSSENVADETPAPAGTESSGGTLVVAPGRPSGGASEGEGKGSGAVPRAEPNLMLDTRGGLALVGKPGIEPAAPALEAPDFKFASFFDRVHERIQMNWRPEADLRRHYESGKLRRKGDGESVVAVTIGLDGAVVEVELLQRGAAAVLDELAVAAARLAGPFVNPPRGLFDENGRARFKVGFHVKLELPDVAQRILKPHGNVVGFLLDNVIAASPYPMCLTRKPRCSNCREDRALFRAVFEPCAYKP